MKFFLLMIGKTTDNELDNLIQDYQKRIGHYVNFESWTIPELKNTKHLSVQEQKEKEADLILKQLDNQDEVILLDEKGTQFTSLKFADYINKKIDSSIKRVVFVVGGPYGFAQKVYMRANGKIAMSAMTFSHQMIRLIFTEQLYRALTIIRGESYHHE